MNTTLKMLRIQNEIHLAAAFEGKPVWDYKPGFGARGGLRLLNFGGLLSFLEMELGLPSLAPEPFSRLLRWWHACQDICQEEEFADFREAFQNDGLAVAERLLSWRDFLVLSGWKPEKKLEGNAPVVLRTLRLIDGHHRQENKLYRGEADRWQALLSVISTPGFNLPLSLKSQKLVCHDPADTLCPAYQKVLEILQGKGLDVEFRKATPSARKKDSNLYRVQEFLLNGLNSTSEKPLAEMDDSFKIVDFQGFAREEDVLARALNSSSPEVVIANHDDYLKSVFQKLGHSASFGLKVAYPGGTQFLRCVGKLVFCPVWKDNITSFLINSPCPVPRQLARQLVRHLEGGGNFGPAWDAIIDTWFQNQAKEGKHEWNALQQEDLIRFLPYQNNYGERDAVPVAELVQQYERVIRWAEHKRPLPDTIALYSAIMEAASRMVGFLKLWNQPDISLIRFEKAAKRLLLAMEIKFGEKEAGSPDVVQNPGTILGEVQSLYWAGFAGGKLPSSVYQEIGPAVHTFLNETCEDYLPETSAITRKREWYQWVRAIAQVTQRCCLVMPRFLVKENGVHALYPELLKLKGLKSVKPQSVEEEYLVIAGIENPGFLNFDFSGIQNLFPNRRPYFPLNDFSEWLVDNISEMTGRLRLNTCESPSSLDKLIQHPMEWLLSKLKGFNMDNPDNFSNTKLAEGNAFHRFAELVFAGDAERQDGLNLLPFKPAAEDKWKELLRQSILEKASILLLPEHRLEHSKFRKDALKAMAYLCRLIEDNGFNRIGIENAFRTEMSEEFPVACLSGKIDMILGKADSEGNLNDVLVLDLKWSNSEEKFEKLVADNDSVQLAVYARFVPEARCLSYLLLPVMLLVGADHQSLKLPFGMSIADPEEIFNQARAVNVEQKLWESVRFRLREFLEGRIEVGDDLPVSNLKYGKEPKGRLISLNHSESKKKHASFSDRFAVLLEEQLSNHNDNKPEDE
jgi:hypothetical protein